MSTLRLSLAAALAASFALPAAAQTRPQPRPQPAERADTVEFKLGRRVQIVRTPGTDRQQRVRISRDRDTTDVTLDINPDAFEGWMRRILILDDDTAAVRTGDTLGVPLRVRLRTRRAPGTTAADAPRGQRLVELVTRDGRVLRDTLSDGQPLPEAWRALDPEDIRSLNLHTVVRRDADGTLRPGRASALRVERVPDGTRPGGEVLILRDGDTPGGAVRLFRDGEAVEEDVRVVRDGQTVRIERNGTTRTVRLARTPETRADGTLVVPDGKGGAWIYLPPRGQ